MHIHVLYFAFFRERLGMDAQELALDEGATVDDALQLLARMHPCIASMQGRFRAACNQEMVDGQTVLGDGDELALIPPVAGGADGEARHCKVIDAPLSLDRVVSAVSNSAMGGIVTFTGQVRDFNDGHAVERLEYEAYEDMAIKVMSRLCSEIEAELPGARLAVEHRIGKLAIGDVAVVIAAAAPHRAEAFTACRALIDRLKEQVPIWKKEIAPGGAEWIGMGP